MPCYQRDESKNASVASRYSAGSHVLCDDLHCRRRKRSFLYDGKGNATCASQARLAEHAGDIDGAEYVVRRGSRPVQTDDWSCGHWIVFVACILSEIRDIPAEMTREMLVEVAQTRLSSRL